MKENMEIKIESRPGVGVFVNGEDASIPTNGGSQAQKIAYAAGYPVEFRIVTSTEWTFAQPGPMSKLEWRACYVYRIPVPPVPKKKRLRTIEELEQLRVQKAIFVRSRGNDRWAVISSRVALLSLIEDTNQEMSLDLKTWSRPEVDAD